MKQSRLNLDSKVEIINNEVYVDGYQVYYTIDENDSHAAADWSNDTVYFYMRERGREASLNQCSEEINARICVNRKTANKIYQAFEEVERNNEKILQSVQE
jgi:membrane carboxypeptidase/penicillin-binding protein